MAQTIKVRFIKHQSKGYQREIIQHSEVKNDDRRPKLQISSGNNASWNHPQLRVYIAFNYHTHFNPEIKMSWSYQFKEKGVYHDFLQGIYSISKDKRNCEFNRLDIQIKKIMAIDSLIPQKGLGETKWYGDYYEILSSFDPVRYCYSYYEGREDVAEAMKITNPNR